MRYSSGSMRPFSTLSHIKYTSGLCVIHYHSGESNAKLTSRMRTPTYIGPSIHSWWSFLLGLQVQHSRSSFLIHQRSTWIESRLGPAIVTCITRVLSLPSILANYEHSFKSNFLQCTSVLLGKGVRLCSLSGFVICMGTKRRIPRPHICQRSGVVLAENSFFSATHWVSAGNC
jgi:hypothetical protein